MPGKCKQQTEKNYPLSGLNVSRHTDKSHGQVSSQNYKLILKALTRIKDYVIKHEIGEEWTTIDQSGKIKFKQW